MQRNKKNKTDYNGLDYAPLDAIDYIGILVLSLIAGAFVFRLGFMISLTHG